MTVTASRWTGSPKMVETWALWPTVSPIRSSSSVTISERSVVVAAIAGSLREIWDHGA
jgi:hypothetical protein